MNFDGFFALPAEAQAGIIAFAAAMTLLIVAQVVMASSLRSRSQSATLKSLRDEVRALSQHTDGARSRPASNGLAPPPKPVKRRGARRVTYK